MALTRQKKQSVVTEVTKLLTESKMTVVAAYQHTTVKAMQQLKREGRSSGTKLRVIKNRLMIKALLQTERLSAVDTTKLRGQLIYAFNSTDEVAPAQLIAQFIRTNPTLEFVGAISSDGQYLEADTVKALATLPGKNELISQVTSMLASPLDQVINGLSGNLHALLDAVAVKLSA